MRTGVATLFVVLAVVAAGCGGNDKSANAAPPPATAGKDQGREVVGALVDAAAAGNTQAMWDLLSRPSKRRFGPTEAAFAKGKARALRRQLAPFAGGKLPLQISQNIDDLFGLVVLSRGSQAYAVPLRHEGSDWRVELGGPLSISVSGPPPNSRGKFLEQIGVETHGPQRSGVGLLYLDGVTLDAKSFAGPRSATLYANFESKLTPGVHTATAFASAGDNATARAWTFRP